MFLIIFGIIAYIIVDIILEKYSKRKRFEELSIVSEKRTREKDKNSHFTIHTENELINKDLNT